MAGPNGGPDPYRQRRIEELRQHIQELVDEMTFYQIRWDSLAREGTPDATRELRFFDDAFSELESEIMDLENQLHKLEAEAPEKETSLHPVDHSEQTRDLIALQKQEMDYIEEIAALQRKGALGEPVEEKLTELQFKLDYLRKEINDIHG